MVATALALRAACSRIANTRITVTACPHTLNPTNRPGGKAQQIEYVHCNILPVIDNAY